MINNKSQSSNFCLNDRIEKILQEILTKDPYLIPYQKILKKRIYKTHSFEKKLTRNKTNLADFASGHHYFGLHFVNNEWIFREWAPNATSVVLIGQMSEWKEKKKFELNKINKEGIWEIHLPADKLKHKQLYRLKLYWPDGSGDRIPSYATRVIQDPVTLIFNAQVWLPLVPYRWQCKNFTASKKSLLIYEAHVGMSLEEAKISTFKEFTENIIPRIADAGYNTLQLMAIQEHPYYASFGYQVSSFFASSSRFGTPEDLKKLIDTAHLLGLNVIMDIIHSHAVLNETEGLSRFDGTYHQYFHNGKNGYHTAWNSRCFDYEKHQVIHFLLSNCKYWIEEYKFDGFRFDGVTSMLYLDHGLEKAFTCYDDYFNSNINEDAYTYLCLANKMIHEIRKDAIVIAEDISGMPGLAEPILKGGAGFDFRFSMGISDTWIRLIKETPDENWHMGHIWHELTNRRENEKTISYAESHDQALVGDKTLIFRLINSAMYHHMHVNDNNINVERGIAIIKLIKLITFATAKNGFLNFMGNEFGHPEWIDFPREGNRWSYHYARRQWSLADNQQLKYHCIANFDRDMLCLSKQYNIFESSKIRLLHEHNDNKIIAFERAELMFVFNFHPFCSHVDYQINTSHEKYKMILDTDDNKYDGHNRLIPDQEHCATKSNSRDQHKLSFYLPTRTAIVLKKV